MNMIVDSRLFSIIAVVLFAVVAVSGCSAKGNTNPGVTGTTGITGTSGGTTGTGTAAPLPGTPTTPGTSDRVRPAASDQNDNDGQIMNEVAEKLKNAGLSESKIKVDVDDGIVTLEGTVTTSEEAERAINLARSVPNVRNVVSKLQVTE